MSCAPDFAPVSSLPARQAGLTSAPLPTITLLLTIGSLPLPFRDQCTG